MADISDEIRPDPFVTGKVKRNLVLLVIAALLVSVVVVSFIQFSGKPSVDEQQDINKQEANRQEVSQMPAPRTEDLAAIFDGDNNAPAQPHTQESSFGADSIIPGNKGGDNNGIDGAQPNITEAERQRAAIATSGIMALESDASVPQAALPNALDGLRDMLAIQSGEHATQVPDVAALAKLASGISNNKPAPDVAWLENAEKTANRDAIHADPPMSEYTLYQGSVIPVVSVTRIVSSLPGYITAQVTEDVFDSVHGRNLLIPKGSRVIGTYSSEIADGQERLMAAYDRIILRNGASIQLRAMIGHDGQGSSGVGDMVDRHFWKRFGPPFLVSVLARLATKSPDNITVVNGNGDQPVSLSDATGQILVDTARQMLDSGRSIQNTLIIRQGHKFNILVNRDLVFTPELIKGTLR